MSWKVASWRSVLVASLGLNVFLLGFTVARWHRGPEPAHFGRGMDGRLGRSDPELARTLRQRFEQSAPQRQQMRAAREGVRRALLREPFDRSELTAALSTLRGNTSSVQEAMHAALADVAEHATPEQRQRLARSRWLQGEARGREPRR